VKEAEPPTRRAELAMCEGVESALYGRLWDQRSNACDGKKQLGITGW